jgi:hypothetical protein
MRLLNMKSESLSPADEALDLTKVQHALSIPCRVFPIPKNTNNPTIYKMSSSTTRPPASSSTSAQPAGERSFFEQQREILLKEIGVVGSVSANRGTNLKLRADESVRALSMRWPISIS